MSHKKTNFPFFTVIITTYNRARKVEEAIDSVLAQTFDDYELIVVDDGSTDETPERLSQRYSESQINYVYQRNRGKPGARNTGIKLARGEYIAFLDSDDRWKPNKLERQAAFIREHDNVEILYGPVEVIDESGKMLVEDTHRIRKAFQRQHHRGETYENLIDKWVLFSSNLVIKRDLIERIGGYDEAIHHLEDVDLYLRVALNKCVFHYIDDPLAEYRCYEGNTRGDDHFRGLVSVAQKHLGAIQKGIYKPGQPSLAKSRLYLKIAESYYVLNDFPKIRWAVGKTIRLKPVELLKSRTILHFFLTFLPGSWLAWIRSRKGSAI